MIEAVYEVYVDRFLNDVSDRYGIDKSLLKYYWDTLYKGCQYTYIQGDKKGCKCDEKVKIMGNRYCNIHKKLVSKSVLLKKNKEINKFWHPLTKFVFNKSKLVIGYYDGNKILELDDKMKEMCKRYRFRIK